jgi:hypothetical protein
MTANNLTAERLRELLHFEPKTGVFTWLQRRGSITPGAIAGTLHHDGYRQIKALGRLHGSHRLAWLYVNGRLPLGDIDHIDGCRANNAIENLRDVPRSINLQNQRRPRSDNTHGFLGITLNAKTNKWHARIQCSGKQHSLGYFDTPEKAHDAYLMAKRAKHQGCTI